MTDVLAPTRYRMPAEWLPHESTWLSWPHNIETWPVRLEAVESTMALAVRALLQGEHVDINVLDSTHARHVQGLIGSVEHLPFSVRYHEIPTNDAWCRDHGAIFVESSESSHRRIATVWRYNAWGGKYPPYDLDEQVGRSMADALGIATLDFDMVLEGGSIEIDEKGRLMTTGSCLLNPNRNPGMTREKIEGNLRDNLGATEIIWLGGEIAGDDTDGHIDNLARFVGRNVILAASERNPNDPNHESLQTNVEHLRSHRFVDGSTPEVIELPMPKPVFAGRDRLPASYCNFYIGNKVVLLPTYQCKEDEAAASILESCFPDRRIVGLDCRDVVRGLGAFHCLTQQIPL